MSKRASRLSDNAKGGWLVAVIGDEDTVAGLLLAGTGEMAKESTAGGAAPAPSSAADGGGGGDRGSALSVGSNYLVVRRDTPNADIEAAFWRFTRDRDDIAVLLVCQPAANRIRRLMSSYAEAVPAVLEIPSKDSPYDPSQDTTLRRVKMMLGMRED